jgi:hypothetical protein
MVCATVSSRRRPVDDRYGNHEMKIPLIATPPWTPEEENKLRESAIAGDHPGEVQVRGAAFR